MTNADRAIIASMALATLAAIDMWLGYRRGKVTGKWGGIISRKGRPAMFRRYTISNLAFIVLCLGFAAWQVTQR